MRWSFYFHTSFQYEFTDFFTFYFLGWGELGMGGGGGGCGARGGLGRCGARGDLRRRRIGLRGWGGGGGARGGGRGARGRCGAGQRGGGGDGSASGSTSSHRFRSSHLVRPPVVPCDDNRVVIIPCGDGWVSHTFMLCFNWKFDFNLLTLLCLSFFSSITDRDCITLLYINISTSTPQMEEVAITCHPAHSTSNANGRAIYVRAITDPVGGATHASSSSSSKLMVPVSVVHQHLQDAAPTQML
jgi:hypothetical protein